MGEGFLADALRMATEGDTVWSESACSGHRQDESTLDMRGVIIMGIRENMIAWSRLYMEETVVAGPTPVQPCGT